MSRQSCVAALLMMACAATVFSQTVVPSSTTDKPVVSPQDVAVPLKRIVLYASGVGFFEHRGQLDGNASVSLRFKTDQINDILKSLVIADPGGSARAVGYPSLEPLTKTLRSFQIDLSSNPSISAIFEQIRGAAVTVRIGDDVVNGLVIGIESRQRSASGENTKPISVSYVNIRTSGGIRSVSVDEIRTFEIEDEILRREFGQALAAISSGRDKDKKPVVVDFAGKGLREVSLGYVVETPVWKTSYRLTLPSAEDKGAKGALQGWAIVENQTDNDWQNVTIDLVGGRPLSFIEDLYNPFYIPRPVSRPSLVANIGPQIYGGGIRSESAAAGAPVAQNARRGFFQSKMANNQIANAPMAVAAPKMDGDVAQEKMDAAQAWSVNAVAEGAQIGEMFQYVVKNVTLQRQRSAMLPIVADTVEVQRVSIFNQGVMSTRALQGARVKNITGKYLLGGPITVFDSTAAGPVYAGDAKIEDMPNGQNRLMSFGMDQDLLFDVKPEYKNNVVSGSLVKGVLQLKRKNSQSQEYTVDNKSDRSKDVIIETPIVHGYEIKAPEKWDTKTDTVYRFQIAAQASQKTKLTVRQEQVLTESISILPLDVDAVLMYVQTGEISRKVRDALQDVIQKKQALVEIQRQQELAAQLRKRQMEELQQTRDNIRVLPSNSKSHQDQITRLTEKDEELRKTIQRQQELQEQVNKAQKELENYVNGLNLE